MRLLRFRIYDYKSIADSEYCWLASDMTVLAGKNESGKTAILQALFDFDASRPIADDAIPIADPSKKPRLELSFEIDSIQLASICQTVGIGSYSGQLLSSIPKQGLTIYKTFPDLYTLGKDILKTLVEIRELVNKPHLDSIQAAVRTINGDKLFPDLPDPKFEDDPSKTASNITVFVANVGQKAEVVEESRRAVITEQIALINSEAGKLITNIHRKFVDNLKPLLPHFILFNDFSDLLPYEITFEEANKTQIVLDFAKLANVDLNTLEAEANTTRRRNDLARASATISDNFAGYWNQNQLRLVAEPDGDILRIGIQDAGRTEIFNVQHRSKGLQWFLSFYLRMHARSGATNIILIDEPGLYLHAKAQKDVY